MVHCKVGASRSATIVIAFLMIKRHMTVQEAVRMVRSKREIAPNEGFLQQLCNLNDKLHSSGHFEGKKVDVIWEIKDLVIKVVNEKDTYICIVFHLSCESQLQ